jgi:hypothetical protein
LYVLFQFPLSVIQVILMAVSNLKTDQNLQPTKSTTLRVFEAFAGYGGASFALKRTGINYNVIGYSENDKFASALYEKNHPDVPAFGDITQLDPNTLPDFDLFTGGFPCQPFSQVGLGKGESDTRGTLFHDIVRVCEAKRPKHILLENVNKSWIRRHIQSSKLKGLWNTPKPRENLDLWPSGGTSFDIHFRATSPKIKSGSQRLAR